MIVSAAILSKIGDVYISDFLPDEVKKDIRNQVDAFLYTINRDENDPELPYYETTYSRYIFKETEDLYWLLVTKTESDLESDINLLGRFVCTIMAYGTAETTSITLTKEQKDLFYRHIWRAWDVDPQCLTCGRCNMPANIWEHDFALRVQFLSSLRDGQVEDKDIAYFNDLITESWAISAKLAQDSSKDSDESEVSICEGVLVDGCRLTCLMEDIRITLKRIQDPYMRLFARRDLLKDPGLNTMSNEPGDNHALNNFNNSYGNNTTVHPNNSVDDSFEDSSFSH